VRVLDVQKHASSRTAHARPAKGRQALKSALHRRITLPDDRFEIVVAMPRAKVAYCPGRGIGCQSAFPGEVGVDRRGGNVDRRRHDDVPRFPKLDRRQYLSYAFPNSGVPAYENRNIGAEPQAQARESIDRQAGLPEPIQGEQRGRGVRASSAESATDGDALMQGDFRAIRTPGRLL